MPREVGRAEIRVGYSRDSYTGPGGRWRKVWNELLITSRRCPGRTCRGEWSTPPTGLMISATLVFVIFPMCLMTGDGFVAAEERARTRQGACAAKRAQPLKVWPR